MKNELIQNYFYNKAISENKPVGVMIELLTKCNLRCKHCYLPTHIESGFETNYIKKLLCELRELGIVNVSFTGGEIFLREDIFELIKTARDLHMRVFLLSNATLLTEQKIKMLSELYITEFSTTIFSLKEEINDFITEQKGSLKIILDNLQLLKKYNIKVQVKTPLMDINCNDLNDIERYCKKNNFAFHVSPIIFPKLDGNDEPQKMMMKHKDLLKTLNKIDQVTRNTHLHTDNIPCTALLHSFAIDCNGNVFPCNSFFYKVGNVYDNPIKNIWYDSKELKFIKSIRNTDLKGCISCEYSSQCDRCPGMAFLNHQDVFSCDVYSKELAKIRLSKYC